MQADPPARPKPSTSGPTPAAAAAAERQGLGRVACGDCIHVEDPDRAPKVCRHPDARGFRCIDVRDPRNEMCGEFGDWFEDAVHPTPAPPRKQRRTS